MHGAFPTKNIQSFRDKTEMNENQSRVIIPQKRTKRNIKSWTPVLSVSSFPAVLRRNRGVEYKLNYTTFSVKAQAVEHSVPGIVKGGKNHRPVLVGVTIGVTGGF